MPRYKFINDKNEHLHTLDGEPLTGTSSVGDVLFKPLAYYAAGHAVQVFGVPDYKVLTRIKNKKAKEEEVEALKTAVSVKFEELKNGSLEDFIKLLDKAYRAHQKNTDKKAKEGTDLHAELEKFVKTEMGKMDVKEFDPKIQPFIDWARKNVKRYLWSEAHCYSARLWVGGISDVGVELSDGTLAIIDFKSSREAYTTHFIQCAGYAIQIEENGLFDLQGEHNKKIDGKISKLIVVPFGAKEVIPVIMRDVEAFKRGFECGVELYRLIFNHQE